MSHQGRVILKNQVTPEPFIANNGQVDEQVRFYAKTFGGTVFVTKDGEIVYALPEVRNGRDVLAGASQQAHGDALGSMGAWVLGRKAVFGWHGQAPLVRAEAECAVNGYLPLFHTDNANCPSDRIFAKSLIAAYLPELQEGTTNHVGTWRPCPFRLAHLSGLQKGTDKQGLSMPPNPHSAIQNPQSPLRGVALKERLVGGKIDEINGGAQSVTTVSYFKGNDPSKWKSGISTYEVVNMGDVYNGIGLQLKAHGNNVEKLFTVKPGANPEQIKIRLDGIQSSPVFVETHCYASPPQSYKKTHSSASLHNRQSIFEVGKQPPVSPLY